MNGVGSTVIRLPVLVPRRDDRRVMVIRSGFGSRITTGTGDRRSLAAGMGPPEAHPRLKIGWSGDHIPTRDVRVRLPGPCDGHDGQAGLPLPGWVSSAPPGKPGICRCLVSCSPGGPWPRWPPRRKPGVPASAARDSRACGCWLTVKLPAFQAGTAGSSPVIRSLRCKHDW